MALTTRRVTASGEPVPLTSASSLRSLYQSNSGAVSSSYRLSRRSIASSVSSSRWTTSPPQTSQVQFTSGGAAVE